MNETNEEKKNSNFRIVFEVILYIVAIVIIRMTFDGTNEIERAAYKMSNLRSVSGETVAEAYYQ